MVWHEGPVEWGGNDGRYDREREENIEPNLDFLHNLTYPNLRHQVLESGPKM